MRVLAFGTPLMDTTGLVRFVWSEGDALPLLMDVALEGADIADLRAEVWTNAGACATPDAFRAVAMEWIETNEGIARFAVALAVERVGNYRAVGRVRSVSGSGGITWASDSGVADVRFRPRDRRHRALFLEEISVAHVNWDPATKTAGTFADLVAPRAAAESGAHDSAYTLQSLAARGVTGVWLMPPSPVSLWEQRHALDDLGSPYAVKDWLAVRKGLTRAEDREGALAEARAFIEQAHALDMRVLLDVALNHVGHAHVIDGAVVETSAPWMLASRHGDPRGAKSADDKIAGGFGEWPDTAQLNHGRVRDGYAVWRDLELLPEHRAVHAYLERVLAFWVDLGVDGFRLDHLCGLPPSLLEGALNRVQARTERSLFLVGEDFHTATETRHFVDAIQGGFFRDLLAVRAPADFERVLTNAWFNDVLALSTHDEPRPMVALSDDARAVFRLHALLLLAGGPVAMVAGDHLGERVPLPFKRSRGVEALRAPSREGREMAERLARVGLVRKELPALQSEWRAFLHGDHGAHTDVLAMARFSDDDESVVFVVASFANEMRACSFPLDDESARRFRKLARPGDTGAHIRLRDVLTGGWTSCVITEGALHVVIAPHEVMVLR